jgi:hypothetical protein
MESAAMKRILLAAALGALLGAPGAAAADGHRYGRGGWYGHGAPVHGYGYGYPRVVLGIGLGPLWYPGYSYPGYYAPPAVIVTQPSTTTYVQSSPAPENDDYWYYCTSPKGYYPYVKKCPPGWMKVVPQTPGE